MVLKAQISRILNTKPKSYKHLMAAMKTFSYSTISIIWKVSNRLAEEAVLVSSIMRPQHAAPPGADWNQSRLSNSASHTVSSSGLNLRVTNMRPKLSIFLLLQRERRLKWKYILSSNPNVQEISREIEPEILALIKENRFQSMKLGTKFVRYERDKVEYRI